MITINNILALGVVLLSLRFMWATNISCNERVALVRRIGASTNLTSSIQDLEQSIADLQAIGAVSFFRHCVQRTFWRDPWALYPERIQQLAQNGVLV